MKRYYYIIASICVASGCSNGSTAPLILPGPDETVQVRGRVVEESGRVVPGAEVYINPVTTGRWTYYRASGSTSSSGNFSFLLGRSTVLTGDDGDTSTIIVKVLAPRESTLSTDSVMLPVRFTPAASPPNLYDVEIRLKPRS